MSIFKAINDLLIAAVTKTPRIKKHLIFIVQKTGDVESGFTVCIEKDGADKIWSNFKRHFKNTNKSLDNIRSQTFCNASCHQAGTMAQERNENILQVRIEIIETNVTYEPELVTFNYANRTCR